jgi:predicted transcriptional regulator
MPNTDTRPDRDAKIDARCSKQLRKDLEIIARVKDQELSDVVRDALKKYVTQFQQSAAAA